MPNSFQQPITPGSRRSYQHGENYGSGPMGLPIRRMMREGSPAGYEIQFQDEWMPMDQFNDPTFQSAFFEPWRRSQLPPGWSEQGGPRFGRGSGPRRGGSVGSRSRGGFGRGRGGGGGGGRYDPAMIEALLGG